MFRRDCFEERTNQVAFDEMEGRGTVVVGCEVVADVIADVQVVWEAILAGDENGAVGCVGFWSWWWADGGETVVEDVVPKFGWEEGDGHFVVWWDGGGVVLRVRWLCCVVLSDGWVVKQCLDTMNSIWQLPRWMLH